MTAKVWIVDDDSSIRWVLERTLGSEGFECESFADGEALLSSLEVLRSAQALVVVAGMDGALPSVVAGLVACPVFAVPTSVGYGAAFGGIAPLLTMLNACAPGVGVVSSWPGGGWRARRPRSSACN